MTQDFGVNSLLNIWQREYTGTDIGLIKVIIVESNDSWR